MITPACCPVLVLLLALSLPARYTRVRQLLVDMGLQLPETPKPQPILSGFAADDSEAAAQLDPGRWPQTVLVLLTLPDVPVHVLPSLCVCVCVCRAHHMEVLLFTMAYTIYVALDLMQGQRL